jgi:hypothetical protein
MTKNAAPEVVEIFGVRFSDFAKQETFQAGSALAIIRSHLRHQPVRFSAATSAAVTDCGGSTLLVAKARRRAGSELA